MDDTQEKYGQTQLTFYVYVHMTKHNANSDKSTKYKPFNEDKSKYFTYNYMCVGYKKQFFPFAGPMPSSYIMLQNISTNRNFSIFFSLFFFLNSLGGLWTAAYAFILREPNLDRF